MKRGFTLIEMLIVVVVLAALMGIVVKIASNNKDIEAKLVTITRLQRLENCLSGYYAAYGGYPPVALHGSRDIYRKVAGDGVQLASGDRNEGIWGNPYEAWKQVKAACLSQPVACNFPLEDTTGVQQHVDEISDMFRQLVESADEDAVVEDAEKYLAGFNGLGSGSPSVGELNRKKNVTEWESLKLFKFGLMSYLLPRYIIMTGANKEFYTYAQWVENNENPSDPFNGLPMNWDEVNELAKEGTSGANKLGSISSQRVCSRWLPNLEKTCCTFQTIDVFGIDITAKKKMYEKAFLGYRIEEDGTKIGTINPPLDGFIYTPSGKQNDYRDQYLLHFVTVQDGWDQDFYYYSPSPHQRYQLWSAGPNARTFPPWVARESLPANANEIIHKWTNDDIMQMSH